MRPRHFFGLWSLVSKRDVAKHRRNHEQDAGAHAPAYLLRANVHPSAIRAPAEGTIVELSKKKLLLLILGSGAFVVAGVWMLLTDANPRDPIWFFRFPVVIHGTGLAGIVFFGFCGVSWVGKLFDRRPGLVLNADGLMDNSSGTPAGLVPWADITGFETTRVFGQELLVVKIADATRYVEVGSPIMRTLRRMNLKLCGSPIALSSNALGIGFAELVEVCNDSLGKYRTSA